MNLAIAEKFPITFVCCIESGPLETQTIRMVESLRRWGGRLANAPVLAITPRWGLPITAQTKQTFSKFDVKYLHFQAKSGYSWNKFMNKLHALVAAEECSNSEYICWLDSDLLILGEPDRLLPESEDFLACPVSKSIATTGATDPQNPFWQEVARTVGIENIEEIPWITTAQEGERIRLYWNSGVFVYRRSTQLAKKYLQVCLQLLDARISNRQANIFFTDQVALALTVVKSGISWGCLPYSHNYGWGTKSYAHWHDEEKLRTAKIFHYHDAMWPDFWPITLKCLCETHPPVAEWLSSLGPLANNSPRTYRMMSQVLKYIRSQQESAYVKSCRVI
ncbi:MAG: hypothetical protein KME17_03520 [Cyanosarcina radialis HA8281-LM2]|jgi:hypothetical protein|nr:hypothetical protein [Cyanosarcina radialis HA8281-LM2]